jgi:potassium-transporting ATPase potassium-binding subunit
MTANGWFQIFLFLAIILAATKPLGIFMAQVFNRERTFLDPVARPLEKLLYRLTGVDEDHDMRWTEYAVAMLLFSGVSMAVLYLIERVQQFLPWNPQKFGAVGADLAFNTAASFTTNTNWQNYAGEATMSYLTQMAGWLITTSFPQRLGLPWRLHLSGESRAGKKKPSATSGSI